MKKVLISDGQFLRLVAQDFIAFCKADNYYTSFFLKDGDEIIVCQSLKKIQQSLDADVFLRVSQSYLINKEYIKLIDKKQKIILLSGGYKVPFTRPLNELVSSLIADILPFEK